MDKDEKALAEEIAKSPVEKKILEAQKNNQQMILAEHLKNKASLSDAGSYSTRLHYFDTWNFVADSDYCPLIFAACLKIRVFTTYAISRCTSMKYSEIQVLAIGSKAEFQMNLRH